MRINDNETSYKENVLSIICSIIFYFAYFFIISSEMLSNVIIMARYVSLADKIGYVLLMISFLLYVYKRNIKVILIQTFILAVFLISYYVSKQRELLYVFLLIIAFQGMDLNKLINYDLALKIFFVIIVVSLYFLGLTDPYYLLRDDGQIRSSMGFVHPNTFGAYLLSISLSIYFIRFKKIGIFYYFFIFFIVLIIRYFSDSRTSINALILLCLLHILLKLTKGKIFKNKMISFLSINSFVIHTLMSLLLGYLYRIGNAQVNSLNELFTDRISLINHFMELYDITPFGNEIVIIYTREAEFLGIRDYFVLDNGFVFLLLRYGLIPFLLMAFIFRKMMKNLLDMERYDYVIIYLVFLATGFFETFFYSIVFNIFLLTFSQLVSRQTSENANAKPAHIIR